MLRLVIRNQKRVSNYKYSLSISSILWFFLLIWNFEPQYFREDFIPVIHTTFVVGRLASALIISGIIFLRLLRFKDYKPSGFFLFIVVEEFSLVLASTLNPEANKIIRVLLDNILLVIPFIAGLDYMFQKKPVKMIGILLLINEILLYGNMISLILHPNGLYNVVIGNTRKYYLLGQQNQTILYIMLGLVTSLLHSQYVTKKRFSIRNIMLIAASIYMEIKFKSAAGLVGLFIFTGIFLLTEFKHVSIDLRWGLIASAVVFLIFVVFQSQEMFTGILVNILHRDITASTRTTIWAKAMLYIERRPILGYGAELNDIAILRFGYVTPHNRWLYMLYRGGFVFLIAFIIMVLKSAQKLSSTKFERASVYLTGALFALMLQMQFESYDTTIFYILFIMAFHVKDIIIAIKEKEV